MVGIMFVTLGIGIIAVSGIVYLFLRINKDV